MSVTDYSEIGEINNYPENINVLKDTKFRFILRKIPNTNFFCTVAEVPSIHLLGDPQQSTPFGMLPVPSTRLDFSDLHLSFLVDEDCKNYFEIFKWLNGIGLVKDFNKYALLKNERTDVNAEFGGIWSDATLFILNNEGNANVEVKFKDAFPWSLSSLKFDSRKTTAEPQIADVTFKYAWFDMVFPSGG